MKNTLVMLLFIAAAASAPAQDTLDLFECQALATESNPAMRERGLYALSADLRLKNINTGWYPSLAINGSYTWQNEVVTLPFGDIMPGLDLPQVPHSNTKLTLDIKQALFDGGMVKAGRELEEASLQVNQQFTDVSLEGLKDRVIQVYFQILLMQKQEKTMGLRLQVLEEQLSVMEAAVRHEVRDMSGLHSIRAEVLQARQKMDEIMIARKSALMILGKLIYRDIDDNSYLSVPALGIYDMEAGERAQDKLFDLQLHQLDASINLVSRKRMPQAYVFGQFGYGNPALDFFRDEFRSYYILGAGLHWNIWDWNKTSREKGVLALQQEIIRTRKSAFSESLSVQQEEITAELTKYSEAVERGREIVALRKEITLAAASRHENGIITTADYIRELNAETEAMIIQDMNEIQLVFARVRYLASKGII